MKLCWYTIAVSSSRQSAPRIGIPRLKQRDCREQRRGILEPALIEARHAGQAVSRMIQSLQASRVWPQLLRRPIAVSKRTPARPSRDDGDAVCERGPPVLSRRCVRLPIVAGVSRGT